MGIDILNDEAGSFRSAAAGVAVFEPRHRTTGTFDGKYLTVDGVRVVDCSGLDYLALGSDPTAKALMMESLRRNDFAIPGSEAVIQTSQSHDLEQALAGYHLGGGAALTFANGYGTNFSVMEALGLRSNSQFLRMHRDSAPAPPTARAPTVFFIDGDLHFSARHGIRFARKLLPELCVAHTYRTNEPGDLEKLLRASFETHGEDAVRIILTDTVESATGREYDMLPLCRLAEQYDCMLYADEAHAVGALGPQGRGVTAKVADFERYRHRLMIMGTLTKVFCQPGGYVAVADPALAAMLKFTSPQHVFSAPVAPWIAAAATGLIALVAGDYGERRRKTLAEVSRAARAGLREAGFDLIGESDTPIMAVPLRDPGVGVPMLEFMRNEGFVLSVFQSPLMPRGREVVRLAMRADFETEDIERLVKALVRCRDALRFT